MSLSGMIIGRSMDRLRSAASWTADAGNQAVRRLGIQEKLGRSTEAWQRLMSHHIGMDSGELGPGDDGAPRAHQPKHSGIQFPSLLAFFSSRYTIALIVMSCIVNRIHAVVHPNPAYRTSAKVRAICRAPAILLLTRACLLVVGMMVRMSSAQSENAGRFKYYHSLRNAIEVNDRTGHASIMWTCFLAACLACVNESFVRAIDHDLASITPINLFSFGLLLHFHASPYDEPLAPPTRAVYFLILLQLAEILALHVAAIRPWRIRLWITGSFALVSRGSMIYFYINNTEKGSAAIMPAIQSLGRILPEAFFVSASVLTIILRALVQLVTERRLSKDIFGHSSDLPHRDDDFILAIIKYGAAALETTAMKGLNNEVAGLSNPSTTFVELHSSSNSASSASRTGTGQVLTTHPSLPQINQKAIAPNPLDSEVKTIKAMSGVPDDVDPASRNAPMRKEVTRFCKALWVLFKVYAVLPILNWQRLQRLAGGDVWIARRLQKSGVSSSAPRLLTDIHSGRDNDISRTNATHTASGPQHNGADLFTDEDDLEDADWTDSGEVEGDRDELSSVSSESDDELQDDGEGMFSRRSRETTPMPGRLEELDELLDDGEEDLTPVLLAHLTAKPSNGTPLTRRRYNAMITSQSTGLNLSPEAALSTAIAVRRHNMPVESKNAEWDDSTFRTASLCVVCCAEQRDIVLWPCRCLALCNDCRGELASRRTGLCPCCRAPVEGFSRIMIP